MRFPYLYNGASSMEMATSADTHNVRTYNFIINYKSSFVHTLTQKLARVIRIHLHGAKRVIN